MFLSAQPIVSQFGAYHFPRGQTRTQPDPTTNGANREKTRLKKPHPPARAQHVTRKNKAATAMVSESGRKKKTRSTKCHRPAAVRRRRGSGQSTASGFFARASSMFTHIHSRTLSSLAFASFRPRSPYLLGVWEQCVKMEMRVRLSPSPSLSLCGDGRERGKK